MFKHVIGALLLLIAATTGADAAHFHVAKHHHVVHHHHFVKVRHHHVTKKHAAVIPLPRPRAPDFVLTQEMQIPPSVFAQVPQDAWPTPTFQDRWDNVEHTPSQDHAEVQDEPEPQPTLGPWEAFALQFIAWFIVVLILIAIGVQYREFRDRRNKNRLTSRALLPKIANIPLPEKYAHDLE